MKSIKKEDLKDIIISSNTTPVILIFSSEHCPACMSMRLACWTYLDSLEHINSYYIDTDNDDGLSDEFEVEYLPTTLFIRNGEVLGFLDGAIGVKDLKEKIELYF